MRDQQTCLFLVPAGASADSVRDIDSKLKELPENITCLTVRWAEPDSETAFNDAFADPSLRAVVTLLEPGWDKDARCVHSLRRCSDRADRRDDFRLAIVLRNLSAETFEKSPLEDVRRIQQTVQFIQLNEVGLLCKDLCVYFDSIRDIVRGARVRTARILTALNAGRIALGLQVLGAGVAVAVWTSLYWLDAQGVVQALGEARNTAAFLAGLPFFGALTVPLYALLQPRFMSRRYIPVGLGSMFVLWCCISTAGSLEHDQKWAMLGHASGMLLDFIRRRKYYAEWRWSTLHLREGVKPGHELGANLLAAAGDHAVDPLRCQIFGDYFPRVFISYTNGSQWSRESAVLLSELLQRDVTKVFLDRKFIGKGTNWQRELRRSISDSNVFISLADEETVKREWTAIELETALDGRRLTGVPYVIVVRNGLSERPDLTNCFPVFRTVLYEIPPSPGGVDILDWDQELTPLALSATLRTHQFQTASVLPCGVSNMLRMLAVPLGWIGAISTLAGLIVLVGVPGNASGKGFTVLRTDAAMVLMGGWLGFLLRVAVAQTLEWSLHESVQKGRSRDRISGSGVFNMAAAVGFILALSFGWSNVDSLTRGWVFTAGLFGWLLANYSTDVVYMETLGR